MKLTEAAILALVCAPGQKDRLVSDDDQNGLCVRVTDKARPGLPGGRTYLVQYRMDGQNWRIPLGECSTGIALKGKKGTTGAREAAAANMGLVASGRNPAAERKAAAEAARKQRERDRLTFESLIDLWRDKHLSQESERYHIEGPRALKRAFADHLKRPAEELKRDIVVRVLDKLDQSMAAATMRYGRACFRWAMKRGSLDANPFQLLPYAPPPSRDRVLSDTEIRNIWNGAAHKTVPTVFGRIVQLLFLTAARREEVAGLLWDEISDDLATWTLPAARAKNGIEHITPLSAPAREILFDLLGRPNNTARAIAARRGQLVLPGQRGIFNGWSKSKSLLDRASAVGTWRLHDARRSVATNLQRLGVRLEVTEAILGHVSGSRSGIVGVYQRHHWRDEKRAALDAWAVRLTEIVESKEPASNVTQLRPVG